MSEMIATVSWIMKLGRTLIQAHLYSMEHPSVIKSIEVVQEELLSLLSAGKGLTLHINDNQLWCDGNPIDELGPLGESLLSIFNKYHIDSISIRPEVTREELVPFIELFADKHDIPDIPAGQDVVQKILFSRGVVNIQCNTAIYAKIEKGETITSLTEEEGQEGKAEVEAADLCWIEEIDRMSLEDKLWTVIQKAVPHKAEQQRIFEKVMNQIQYEMETKVKEATRHLEEEKQQMTFEKKRTEEVVSAAAEGVIVVDPNGKILMMNPAAERLYGAKLKDRAGKDIREILGEDQMLTLSKDISNRFKEGGETVAEIKSTSETEKTLRASAALIQNHEGKVVGMVSTLSNVTKAKELEQMKNDFVASVSHELRTPLASIKQALGLILDKTAGDVNPEQEKMLSLAKRNVERLNRLINDVLDLSKIEAGKMALSRAPHNLSEIVDEVGQTMTLFAQTRDVQISYSAPKDLPRVYIDRDRIIQVFTNLVGNAIKFTPAQGRVSLSASDIPKGGEPPSCLKTAVADTGRGIAKEDLTKVFEKFTQVSAKNTDVKGTGLGLPISKALVEQHGGQIWVESEPGKGSKFTISLPVYKETPAPLDDKAVVLHKSWLRHLISGRIRRDV
jgi:PAS domain S-box-containing protein